MTPHARWLFDSFIAYASVVVGVVLASGCLFQTSVVWGIVFVLSGIACVGFGTSYGVYRWYKRENAENDNSRKDRYGVDESGEGEMRR